MDCAAWRGIRRLDHSWLFLSVSLSLKKGQIVVCMEAQGVVLRSPEHIMP